MTKTRWTRDIFAEGQHSEEISIWAWISAATCDSHQRLVSNTTIVDLTFPLSLKTLHTKLIVAVEFSFLDMAPITSANPPKRMKIPGLLDGNIMVLIYTPDYFESDSVTVLDFADDFMTLNRLHGMVVSRFDIEFYWSFGVRGAYKHGDPRQDFLLGQVDYLNKCWGHP